MTRMIEKRLAGVLAAAAMLLVPAIALAASAKDNFEWYCAQCHGPKGAGDGINAVKELPVGPMNLTKGKLMKKFTSDQITNTLTHGGPINTLDSLMPPWGDRLTKDEIKDLVLYVRSLCKDAECPKQ